MKKLKLRRSPDYKARVRHYASNLRDRFRAEVGDVFLDDVKKAEAALLANKGLGVKTPYVLMGRNILLKEWYFDSGPVPYCLVFDVDERYVNLITLWHGTGSRSSGNLVRIWDKPKTVR